MLAILPMGKLPGKLKKPIPPGTGACNTSNAQVPRLLFRPIYCPIHGLIASYELMLGQAQRLGQGGA